ncbi:hypothetical protein [Hymenobacter nivis]|nr:hypothetical protein [Hymenobacter nivis]
MHYFYNRWSKFGIFEQAYQALLRDKSVAITPAELNPDGTHSPAKKGVQA